MSKHSEILDGREYSSPYRLIYTEVLGGIDLGHAQGTDIRKALKNIDDGESSGQGMYTVMYSHAMGGSITYIKIGKVYHLAN